MSWNSPSKSSPPQATVSPLFCPLRTWLRTLPGIRSHRAAGESGSARRMWTLVLIRWVSAGCSIARPWRSSGRGVVGASGWERVVTDSSRWFEGRRLAGLPGGFKFNRTPDVSGTLGGPQLLQLALLPQPLLGQAFVERDARLPGEVAAQL